MVNALASGSHGRSVLIWLEDIFDRAAMPVCWATVEQICWVLLRGKVNGIVWDSPVYKVSCDRAVQGRSK